MLAVSERTLQRRLGESGHSLRSICDHSRQDLAETLLRSGTASAADLADQLGYSETTSFLHAFKRWNGLTPKKFRAELKD